MKNFRQKSLQFRINTEDFAIFCKNATPDFLEKSEVVGRIFYENLK